MSLGSNGVDRVHSLRKIPTRLRGTNFCTTSARFASGFVRRPNGPECIQIVQYTQKLKMRLRGTNFCTSSPYFALSFVRRPNGPECIQILQYTPKQEFRVQWGGSGAFVAKNSDATSWHELLHKFGLFWTECCNATNCPKCTQIVQNAPKHEVRVQ